MSVGEEIQALCQMMLVKRNLRIIWTEQKEENRLFVNKD